MTPIKTLILYQEDLKSDSTGVDTYYIRLEHFNNVQNDKYKLILFFDTRPEANVKYSTRILKNEVL